MTTDHYAEAKYLMGALDTVDQSDLERRPTIYHFDLARAQVLATLALTDAVRALKAGATVTTTHADMPVNAYELLERHLRVRAERDALACQRCGGDLLRTNFSGEGDNCHAPWPAEEAPRG